MKKFKVSYGDSIFIVDAVNSYEAVQHVRCVADSTVFDKLGKANFQMFMSPAKVDFSREFLGEVAVIAKDLEERKKVERELHKLRIPVDSVKGNTVYVESSMIADSVFVSDSDKLSQMVYKLGQLANYFDRANSAHSRKYLGAEDDKKVAEFYSLGVQTYNQLKSEVDAMKRAGVEEDKYGFTWDNKIVDILRDVIERFYFLGVDRGDAKLKLLSDKFEPLMTEYNNLVKNGLSKRQRRRSIRRDSATGLMDSYEYVNFANDTFVKQNIIKGVSKAVYDFTKQGKKFKSENELYSTLSNILIKDLSAFLKVVEKEFNENRDKLRNDLLASVKDFMSTPSGKDLIG